ncbi:aminotransferase-like domain-containing protein [Pseudonocardia sp. TRM90224]|uniref:aminotransferase-like domain-containing protein n=1 Tax=Pseudonocardia sp. TRM90224 TaxID=2812678 RepID=UPI001E528DF0|nr:PLP-dependent aminotransferase family protein [Pseudonocardia sp. TRM90224]
MDDFRLIADDLAAEIAAGRLRPGDRLPTQRRFARDRGIAVSTASRVYGELVRRGLAAGEVGRGTFVRSGRPGADPALAEPQAARVDLELNFPVLPEQGALLARSLDGLLRPDALGATLVPAVATGNPAARAAAAGVLARPGWAPDPGQILFAGSGRQAIAAALAALVPVGGRLGVEALTYPVARGIAARLGIELVPLAMDDDGLRPDAVAAAGPLKAVYLQPTVHNPLGVTMSPQRRREIAAVLEELDLPAVEDTIYAFLREGPPPLVSFVPDRTVVVDSLSKRIAPGLTVGYLVPPAPLVDRMAAALRSGGWTAPSFALAAATRWATDGTLAEVQEAKRLDAAQRQRLVRERLAGFALHADPAAYHCWWELPSPWRAETFVAAAARRGIAITPAAAFTPGTGHAPNAVRVALSVPPIPVLVAALDTLAELARGAPDADGLE